MITNVGQEKKKKIYRAPENIKCADIILLGIKKKEEKNTLLTFTFCSLSADGRK
jgi:hypothetical protein